MQYDPLFKFYYTSHEEYQNVYQRRFESESTLHFDFTIGESPAFLLMVPEVLNLITDIFRASRHAELLFSDLPSAAASHYVKSCIVDEVRLTNDIEGVVSTRKEIYDVMQNIPTDRSLKVEGLINNYLLLCNSNPIPLFSCEDIRRLYDSLALDAVRAEDPNDIPDGVFFRKGNVDVISPRQQVIHRGLSPEEKIIDAMNQSLSILNDKSLNLLIRTAIFHYLFGYIHPFYNGNGRMSRFISSYMLSNGLSTLDGFRLSVSIKRNIDKYYKAFKITNSEINKGDLTPFVILFLEIVKESVESLALSLYGRSQKLKHYTALCEKAAQGNHTTKELLSILVQAALFGSGWLDIRELDAAVNVSMNTIRSHLKDLAERSLIQINTEHKLHRFSVILEKLDLLQ